MGGRGKVLLKCGGGWKVLVAVGRAPCEKGAHLVRRALPYCLFLGQGAQAPIDYLIGRGL